MELWAILCVVAFIILWNSLYIVYDNTVLKNMRHDQVPLIAGLSILMSLTGMAIIGLFMAWQSKTGMPVLLFLAVYMMFVTVVVTYSRPIWKAIHDWLPF